MTTPHCSNARHVRLQRRGMTLVELIVGMAIATLMTLAGWRAIEALQAARDQTYRDATQWQSLDTLFTTLESDLRRADWQFFSGNATSLTLRLNPLIPTEPLRTVRYRWVSTDSGHARVIRQSDDGEIALVEAKNARFAFRKSPTPIDPAATSVTDINEYPKAVELAIELLGNNDDASDSAATPRIVHRTLVLR